jgi:lipopolysaccharide transport system ATP-binding protein
MHASGPPATGRPTTEEFWALRDVSFEVCQGDRLGIIGRNGAGKSTLLKLLSRITAPTQGCISLKGRVASLLEVGTGFHPELTGRENIFLNGAILGMRRAEIRAKFDEIVAFAEVERFLDTPVKRYSSGMYVRLAFAVAAHLEPEILLVDEVLAVGDAQFQRKCLGKMEDVSTRQGRTVLFVSHNLVAIQKLCNRAILLSGGECNQEGASQDIINHYLNAFAEEHQISLSNRRDRTGTGSIRFTNILFCNAQGETVAAFVSGGAARIIISMKAHIDMSAKNVRVDVGIDNCLGERIAWISSSEIGGRLELRNDLSFVQVDISRLQLAPGKYVLTVYADIERQVCDWVKEAGIMSVESGDYYGTGELPPQGQGCLLLDYSMKAG